MAAGRRPILNPEASPPDEINVLARLEDVEDEERAADLMRRILRALALEAELNTQEQNNGRA